MSETPTLYALSTATHAGDSTEAPIGAPQEKTWEEFDACGRCHGRAQIEETPGGDLYCQLCHARLPRPST